jgi:hypothetical protein
MSTVALKMKSPCVGTNCSKIILTDNTGLYDATTAPQKWSGTNNPGGVTLADIATARVTFTPSSGSNIVYYPKTTSSSLYPSEPAIEFSFAEQDWVGADGIYKMTYEATTLTANTITPYTTSVLITCKTESCIKKLYLKYQKSCLETDKETWLSATDMLEGAKMSFMCNSLTESKSILTTLTKICAIADSDCGCC